MERNNGHFLEGFFNPGSVAVVGVSSNPIRIQHNLLANLVKLGFQGKIYPVNPQAREILGLRVYPDVKAIEDSVDLAVIAVPYTKTVDILKDCAVKGIRRVVIVAGGFSETGEDGRRAQEEMARLVRENGMRAIGPNALSPINTSKNFIISFHPITRLKRGGLSLIFQSGLYEPRLGWFFSDFNLHLNKLIDLGNKMDINEVDALEYLAMDPDTRVIGIHLENIEGDGREFFRILREVSRRKHVVVLKAGRTEAGARAVSSHTGVIVQGSDFVFDAALRQAGAIRAQNIEEFFDLTRTLERFGPLLLRGNRIAISTLPGGEAVITTDLCQQEGLTLASVTEETHKKLRPVFPPWEISANPFDFGVCTQFHNGAEVYRTFIEAMIDDPNVDGLAVQVAFWAVKLLPKEAFEAFPRAAQAGKPIVIWVPGVHPGKFEVLRWLEDNQVPVLPSAERCLKVLSALHRSSQYKLSHKKCP